MVESLADEFAVWLPQCSAAIIAVPGPVCAGEAIDLPNVSWNITRRQLHESLPNIPDGRLILINDFVAQGMACLALPGSKCRYIQVGETVELGLIATIGAGTGIGACALTLDTCGGHCVIPSEAGHQQFPFRSSEERRFEEFVIRKTGHKIVDANAVVSGPGLSMLHSFLTGSDSPPAEVAAQLALSSEVCRMFASFYARVAQAYTLSVLPLGGLYVTGGVAAQNPHLVDNDVFRAEFAASPHHRPLLERIPIFLNENQESGLLGAACYARMILRSHLQTVR